MKKLFALFTALFLTALMGAAQTTHRFPPIDVATSLPSGACTIANAIEQYNGGFYTCTGGSWVSSVSTPAQFSNVLYASRFSGVDAGAKIAAAISAVNDNGLVIADFNGAQTMSVNPFSGITKSVTLRFTGCATYTLSVGIALPSGVGASPYQQRMLGDAKDCTVLQDGANSITLVDSSANANDVEDLTLNYNAHTGVVAYRGGVNGIDKNLRIFGGFATPYLISGALGAGVYYHKSYNLFIDGNHAAQYGVEYFASTADYANLNQFYSPEIHNTTVAGFHVNSGGGVQVYGADFEANDGLGFDVEYGALSIYGGDCEANVKGNTINPNQIFNARSRIECDSTNSIFNRVTNITGTIAINTNSMTLSTTCAVAAQDGIGPGIWLNVAGANFSDATYPNKTYERVTACSGSTVTFNSNTTVAVTSGAVYGPITPVWVSGGGYAVNYGSEHSGENSRYLEGYHIDYPVIEGNVSIAPSISAPTAAIWRIGDAYDTSITDLYIFDRAVAGLVADFSAANHSLSVGSGGYGLSGCCIVIDGSGNFNAPTGAVYRMAGNTIIPAGTTGDTGTGLMVFQTNPTIITPHIQDTVNIDGANGTAASATWILGSAATDWYIENHAATALIAHFDATNFEIWAGAGGYGIAGCCTMIDGSGNVNVHANLEMAGTTIYPAGYSLPLVGYKAIAGTNPPTDTCSPSVNNAALELNATPTLYICNGPSSAWTQISPTYANQVSETLAFTAGCDSWVDHYVIPSTTAAGFTVTGPGTCHADGGFSIVNHSSFNITLTAGTVAIDPGAPSVLGPNQNTTCLYDSNHLNCSTPSAPLAQGLATLVSGTVTVSTSLACTPSATCVYLLSNCGSGASAAVGTPEIGTVTAGTSFVLNSLSATNTVVTGDASKICWRLN